MKTCTRCGIKKPLSEYYPRTRENGLVTVRTRCKRCDSAMSREAHLRRKAATA